MLNLFVTTMGQMLSRKILVTLRSRLDEAKKARDFGMVVRLLNLISDRSRRSLELEGILDVTSDAIQFAKDIRDPIGEAFSLANHAISCSLLDLNDQADEFVQKAIAISDTLPDKSAYCFSLIAYGYFTQRKNEFLEAFKINSQALYLAIELKNKILTKNALFYLARLAFYIGDIDLSIEYVFKGLEIDSTGLAPTYLYPIDDSRFYDGAAFSFWKSDRPDEAIEHYRLAIPFAEKSEEYASLINLRVNMALTYRSVGLEDGAHESMKIATDIYSKIKVKFNQAMFLEDFAQFYAGDNDFKRALNYRKQLDEVCLKSSSFHAMVENRIEIATIYMKMERMKEAEIVLTDAYSNLASMHSDRLRARYHLAASEYHEKMGDFETALDFHKKYHLFHDFHMKDEAKRNLRKVLIKAEIDSLIKQQ